VPSTPRVLVVDDDRLLRLSLRLTLTRDGFAVDLAARVSEAIDLLSRHDYELLVLDMRLPDGSGREVLRWARDLAPNAAVVVLTGSAEDAERDDLVRDGVASVLIKPCSLAEVSREVGNAVSGRSGPSALGPSGGRPGPPTAEI